MPGSARTVNAMATGPNGLVAVGMDVDGLPAAWHSSDGIFWEPALMNEARPGENILDVVYSDQFGYLAVGEADTELGWQFSEIWVSDEGSTWYPAGLADFDQPVVWRAIAVRGSTIITTGVTALPPGEGEEGEYGSGSATFGIWRWSTE